MGALISGDLNKIFCLINIPRLVILKNKILPLDCHFFRSQALLFIENPEDYANKDNYREYLLIELSV